MCARCRPGAGVNLGQREASQRRSGPRSPCAATPSGRNRRGRGCGCLPRYNPPIGYVPHLRLRQGDVRKAALRLVLEKKKDYEAQHALRPVTVCKAQSLPNLGVIFKNWTYLTEVLGAESSN